MTNKNIAVPLCLAVLLPSLSACMATMPVISPAPVTPAPSIERVRLEDKQLTCEQLKAQYEELVPLAQLAGDTSSLTTGIADVQTQYAAVTGTMAATQIGTSVGTSVAPMTMGQVLPFVGPALSVLSSAFSMYKMKEAQEKALQATSTQQRAYEAKARREYLAGLYQEKGCK